MIQMPKIVYFLLISLLLLVLSFDTYVYFTSVANFRRALELALDDGLIAGVVERDSQRGRMLIDNSRGYDRAREALRKNLNLDGALTNRFYSNSEFSFFITVVNEKAVASGRFATRIHLQSLRLLGLDALPCTISKTQEYLNAFI